MKKRESVFYSIFFVMSSFYVSSFCEFQSLQNTKQSTYCKSLTKENLEEALEQLYERQPFLEELYEKAEYLLKGLFQTELESFTQKGERMPPEQMTYHILQLKTLQQKKAQKKEEQQKKYEEQQKILQDHQDYCQNKLLQKVVPDMINDLCSQENVSMEELANAYSLVRFIQEQETGTGTNDIIFLYTYKSLQVKLQARGNTCKFNRKAVSEVLPNKLCALSEEIREIYADYFFRYILNAANAFCSLKDFFYNKASLKGLVDLMDEAMQHEKSLKRGICYRVLQDRIVQHYKKMWEQNYKKMWEQKSFIADNDKQLSISKSKKRYRDKRKKNRVKR